MHVYLRIFACASECKGSYSYKYFQDEKFKHVPSARLAGEEFDSTSTSCYATFDQCFTFFTAISVCKYIGGNLATYDDVKQLLITPHKKTDNCDNPNELCQWIGIVKPIWIWTSKCMLLLITMRESQAVLARDESANDFRIESNRGMADSNLIES